MRDFAKRLRAREDWLMGRVLAYAQERGYVRYTSTLKEAWRLSIHGLSAALLKAMEAPEADLELGPEDLPAADPAAAFALEEARLHRARGISLTMFLGLLKYYRRCYQELAGTGRARGFVERFFDRLEVAVAAQWCALTESAKNEELRVANRALAGEKNRYLTLFETLPAPAAFIAPDGIILSLNMAALAWLGRGPEPGAARSCLQDDREDACAGPDSPCGAPAAESFPWIAEPLERLRREGLPRLVLEQADGEGEMARTFIATLSPSQDIAGAFQGTVLVIQDVTDLERSRERLGRALEEARGQLESRRQAEAALVRAAEEQQLKVRQLTALYGLSGVLGARWPGAGEMLAHAVEAVALGWRQLPACAEITLDGRAWRSECYRPEGQPLRAPLSILGRERGRVSVLRGGTGAGLLTPAQERDEAQLLAAMARQLEQALETLHIHENLARSEKLFREFFDNAADAIFIHDEAGALLDANKGAGIWLNQPTDALPGQGLPDWLDPADREAVRSRFRDALKGAPALYQATFRRRDGFAIPAEVLSQAIEFQGRTALVSSARNISARLGAQAEIERRLGLEGLVASISSRIISAPGDRADEAIVQSLAELCAFVGMRRGGVFLLDDRRGRLRLAHVWRAEGLAPLPADMRSLAPSRMPWLTERVLAGERVLIRNAAHMPPAGRKERALLARAGVHSLAAVPMTVTGRLLGALVLASDAPAENAALSDPRLLDQVALLLANAQEKRRAHEALRASESLSSAIIESLSANICVLDRAGAVTMVNRQWRRFARENSLHGSPSFGPGTNYLEVCRASAQAGEPLAAQAGEGIRSVLEGRVGGFQMEYPCHSPKQQRWFAMQVSPIAGRRRSGVVIAHRDITERTLALQGLSQSEERFRIIVETAREAVLQIDLDTRIQYANPRAQSMFGYSPEELAGRELALILDPEDAGLLQQKLRRRRQGLADQYELRFRHKGGQRVWTLVNAAPLRGREGEVAGSIGMITDISDRIRAEERLRKNEARYRTLVEAMHEGLVMLRRDGRISFANSQFAAMLGRPRSHLVGRPVAELLAPESQPLLARLLATDEAPNGGPEEALWTHVSGRRIYTLLSPALLRDETGRATGIFAVVTDTTERKALESQLLHSQKLEAIGQLAAGIAHEINTPAQYVGNNIQFIKGAFEDMLAVCAKVHPLVEAARQAEPTREAARELEELMAARDIDYLAGEMPGAIAQTLEGVERISTIVRSVRQFAHPGDAVMAPADLNDSMRSTVTVSRNEWKYVADLETDLDPDLPPVVCMIGEINQVVLNLIVNAAHAIAEAQKASPGEKGRITLATRRAGPWAEIRVTDTGGGIPEQVQPRIFDPFFTTKEVGRGTGQGLTISRSIVVEKHGGQIFFETEQGRGTTFVVRLPLRQEEA